MVLRVDIKLLDQWYVLDEQCLPSSYLLQPVSVYFPQLTTGLERVELYVTMLFTDADGSRVSIVIIRICDSVCLSVCLSVFVSVRTIKPKRFKPKSQKNWHRDRSKSQRSRSQGQKCKTYLMR